MLLGVHEVEWPSLAFPRYAPVAVLKTSLADFVKFTRTLKGTKRARRSLFSITSSARSGKGDDGGVRIAKKPASPPLKFVKDTGAARVKHWKKFADLPSP